MSTTQLKINNHLSAVETAILESYKDVSSTFEYDLKSISISVLDEIAQGKPSVDDGSLQFILKQALSFSFRDKLDKAAAAADKARKSLNGVKRHNTAVPSIDGNLVVQLSQELTRISQTFPLLDKGPVNLEQLGQNPISQTLSLNNPAKLKIVNHLAYCVDESSEWGSNDFSVGLVVIDPLGGLQKLGPYGMGSFESGTKKNNSWLFADIDLSMLNEATWPRTYTVVWTLAEKDGGGFGDYMVHLLEKLREYLSKELAKKITASLMTLVGAAVAAKIGAAIGASAGSVVPVIGTIVGAIIGALVGWGVSQLIGAISEWVKDDIFKPVETQLQLNYPGETWGGKTTSDPWWIEWTGHDGRFRLEYTWQLDWGFSSLGASRPSPLVQGKTQEFAYRAADGSIAALYSTEPMPQWSWAAVSANLGAPPALSDPHGFFHYTSYPAGVQIIVYLGTDLHIYQMWESGDGIWRYGSPTYNAQAMLGAGRPWSYFNQGIHHIAYRGLDSQIYVLWNNNSWAGRSPSIDAGAPLAIGDPCALMSNKTQSIYYRGQDGHIHELWAGDTWKWTNVTGSIGAPLAAGNPHAYLRSGQDTYHVTYRGEDGHIWVCWWDKAQGKYFVNSPSQIANAPLAAGDPYGFVLRSNLLTNSGSSQNIVYRGIDGRIYQLWAYDSWHYTDVTHGLELPKAIGNPIAYEYGKDKNGKPMLNIAYLGENAHYYTLWFHGNGWGWANVSGQAGSAFPGA